MTAIINSETFSEAKGSNKTDKSFDNLSRKIMLGNKEKILDKRIHNSTVYKCIRQSDRMNGSSKGRLIVTKLP